MLEKKALRDIARFILKKVKESGAAFGGKCPVATRAGTYQFSENGGWEGGFWPGLNAICYELSRDKDYLTAAEPTMRLLKNRLYNDPESLDHDIGFLYTLSYVADYKLTGNPASKKIALDAAGLLSRRFHEKGGFLQAWNVWNPGEPFSEENRGRMIIDCMYNLPLLFWASRTTGDPKYKQIAEKHADTCAGCIVRPDYTTFHSYVFDPENGEPKYGKTVQGYADDSCWARGQAWAIGGFTFAYEYTGNRRYLAIAKKCAGVFLDALESDLVPVWDLTLKGEPGEPRDSSAAAIAASGLLRLAENTVGAEKAQYRQWAGSITESLFKRYSTRDMSEEQGLLLHACGNKPAGRDTDCSLIYGDYFFAEAVAGLLETGVKFW